MFHKNTLAPHCATWMPWRARCQVQAARWQRGGAKAGVQGLVDEKPEDPAAHALAPAPFAARLALQPSCCPTGLVLQTPGLVCMQKLIVKTCNFCCFFASVKHVSKATPRRDVLGVDTSWAIRKLRSNNPWMRESTFYSGDHRASSLVIVCTTCSNKNNDPGGPQSTHNNTRVLALLKSEAAITSDRLTLHNAADLGFTWPLENHQQWHNLSV